MLHTQTDTQTTLHTTSVAIGRIYTLHAVEAASKNYIPVKQKPEVVI